MGGRDKDSLKFNIEPIITAVCPLKDRKQESVCNAWEVVFIDEGMYVQYVRMYVCMCMYAGRQVVHPDSVLSGSSQL